MNREFKKGDQLLYKSSAGETVVTFDRYLPEDTDRCSILFTVDKATYVRQVHIEKLSLLEKRGDTLSDTLAAILETVHELQQHLTTVSTRLTYLHEKAQYENSKKNEKTHP